MNENDILTHIQQLNVETEIYDYIVNIIDADFKNVNYFLNILPFLYSNITNTSLFLSIICKFLLEQNRQQFYTFILANKNLYKTLAFSLINSEHFQHKLALAELIQIKENRKEFENINEDKDFVNQLLNDEIGLVVKKAIKCVRKDMFNDNELENLIKRLFDDNFYLVVGSCPFLLKFINNQEKCNFYVDLFINSESWLVRFNLCKNINEINYNKSKEKEILDKLSKDSVQEIRFLFCSAIKNIKNKKYLYMFYKKMLLDEDEKVKEKCVDEIKLKINDTKEIYKIKYLFFNLRNVFDDSSIEIKIKICEIFCENMARVIESHKNSDFELIDFFNNELNTEKINGDEIETNLGKFVGIDEIYRNKEDYDFIYSFFGEIITHKNWRNKERFFGMARNLAENGDEFYLQEVKFYHIKLLNDSIFEIRNKAMHLIYDLYKIFGISILNEFEKDLIDLTKSKKFMLKNSVLIFLRLIGEDENYIKIERFIVNLIENIYENLVETMHKEFEMILRLFRELETYEEKIMPIIMKITTSTKTVLTEIIIS